MQLMGSKTHPKGEWYENGSGELFDLIKLDYAGDDITPKEAV